MNLTEFNTEAEGPCRSRLESCLRVDRWVDSVLAGRPYASVQDAVRAAATAARPLGREEIDAALADHPRIGERDDSDSAEAEHSRREQAGLGETDVETMRRLAEGNRAYERRFGRVFLIRAAGRSHVEILAELERRLLLPPEEELDVVGEQLVEIAALRVEGMFR